VKEPTVALMHLIVTFIEQDVHVLRLHVCYSCQDWTVPVILLVVSIHSNLNLVDMWLCRVPCVVAQWEGSRPCSLPSSCATFGAVGVVDDFRFCVTEWNLLLSGISDFGAPHNLHS
jgi:hypothetical protein